MRCITYYERSGLPEGRFDAAASGFDAAASGFDMWILPLVARMLILS